jgi:thymidylate synthase
MLRGVNSTPDGKMCRELLGHVTRVPMWSPLVTLHDRALNYGFAAAEAVWYLTGNNRSDVLAKHIKCYDKYAKGGIITWAYGPKIVDQLAYVIESLNKDRATRRSVLSTWRENPRWDDPPCTLTMQFMIRDDILECMVTMRSSDSWLGWPYDVFSFSMIAMYVGLSLEVRPKHLGELTIFAGSQHIYETDVEKVDALIAQDKPNYLLCSTDWWPQLKSPGHLIAELECIRDEAWGAKNTQFMEELSHDPL